MPGPVRKIEAGGNIVGGLFVPGHAGRRGPGEIVVKDLTQRFVSVEAGVFERPVEAGYRPAVHLFMLAFTAVEPDDEGLFAEDA